MQILTNKQIALNVLNSILFKNDIDMEVDGAIRTAMTLLDPQPTDDMEEARQDGFNYVLEFTDGLTKIIDDAEDLLNDND